MAERLETLEEICRDIGHIIGGALPNKNIGFALLVFDFGEAGHLSYVSNARRQDMITALYECIANLQHGLDQPHLATGPQRNQG